MKPLDTVCGDEGQIESRVPFRGLDVDLAPLEVLGHDSIYLFDSLGVVPQLALIEIGSRRGRAIRKRFPFSGFQRCPPLQ